MKQLFCLLAVYSVFAGSSAYGQDTGATGEQPIPIHTTPLSSKAPTKKKKAKFDLENIIDGEKGDTTPLKDSLDKISVSVAKSAFNLNQFYRCKVTVKNNTDRVLQVQGSNAFGVTSRGNLKCISMAKLVKNLPGAEGSRNKYLKTAEDSITALVSVGSISALRDHVKSKGDIRKRYGFDEVRREEQLRRFANRVIYPGESTAGFIYFSRNWMRFKSIQIPVNDFYNKDNSAILSFSLNH